MTSGQRGIFLDFTVSLRVKYPFFESKLHTSEWRSFSSTRTATISCERQPRRLISRLSASGFQVISIVSPFEKRCQWNWCHNSLGKLSKMCVMIFYRTNCVDCTPRSLSLGIGLIGSIIAVVFLAMTSFMLHASITEGYDQNYLPLRDRTDLVIAALTLSLLAMPCSIILIIGVCKERRVLVLSWLCLLVLPIARDITTIFFALASTGNGFLIGLFLFEIWFYLLGFFVVRSYGSTLAFYNSSLNQTTSVNFGVDGSKV